MTRAELIQRKDEVQAEIARLQRQIAALRERADAGQGCGPAAHALSLQNRLDALLAEEHRLRLLIDRSR